MKHLHTALGKAKAAAVHVSTGIELAGFGALTAAAAVTFGEGAALATGGVSLLIIGYGLDK